MVWDIIIIGAFAVLTTGLVIWEWATKRSESTANRESDADWFDAIK